ncbi:MAG: transcriptional regulator [Burkholderiales bacterium]|nr:transcriptional regulator [Burkholderiales bacterium]
MSKQLRLLEEELGFAIFRRSRSRLHSITSEGQRVLAYARNALEQISNIRAVGAAGKAATVITVATSHTQARYVLPSIMRRFAARFPRVRASLLHGDPGQTAERVLSGEADIGVSTEGTHGRKELVALQYRAFQRVVIVPRGHPLLGVQHVTLKMLARFPLVAYEPKFAGHREVVRTFASARLKPRLIVSAVDADVIKTYVEQGLGIAVLSEVTFDPARDGALGAIPAGHLFPPARTNILLHRRRYLHRHAYEFIQMFAPTWTPAYVQSLANGSIARRNA